MKLTATLLLAATAATVLAVVETGQEPKVPESKPGESEVAGMMPSGRLMGPLALEDVNYDPVTVPEPVWASVLAACAVSLLRRGRH